MRKKGSLCVLACYILWGVLPVFWKSLAAVDSLYVLAARIVWSLVFNTLTLALRGRFSAVRAVLADRRELGRLMLAGVIICVNWGGYIQAVNGGHVLDASLAYYMTPILNILLGTVVFREKLTKLQWLSAAVAFTGLAVTVLRYRQIPWLALAIGGSFALYGAVKKGARSEAGVSVFFETLTLAPFALGYMLLAEARGTGAAGILQGAQWLLLPAAGVVTTVPLLFFAVGVKSTPLTLAGILMYINPTLQLLLSVLLYHEAFTVTHGILFGFVWSGLILYMASELLQERKRRREKPSCV